jgi:antagonist of KipI
LGGALDPHALRVANLLAGNDESAAGLEITFGGTRLRFADDRVIAWCGGGFKARIGATSVPAGHPALVRAGEEFSIDSPALGCRAWLAISGGIDVPLVLGSRSGDLRSGFGGVKGRPLRDREEFPIGDNSARTQTLIDRLRGDRIAGWKPPHGWSNTAIHSPSLRYVWGSDSERFSPESRRIFGSEAFVVSPDSDRMGVRLTGPRLTRTEDADLLSEAVAPGTMQVPPGGNPILLLNDCQTIGGYPKIAHVIMVDLGIAAQLCPGEQVRFQEVSLAEAHSRLLQRDRNLEQFRLGLEAHFK